MDEVREKEVELMRRLIKTLQDENNSKNLQRNTLHLELDRLEAQNNDLRRQLERERRNSRDLNEMLEVLPVEVEVELEQLRTSHQSQQEEIGYLKNEIQRIGNERSEGNARWQHEYNQLEREWAATKKRLAEQSTNSRTLQTQADMLREKELRIQELERIAEHKDEQLNVFSKDIEELRGKVSELSEQLQLSKLEDTHGQLSKYEKELLISRRNYDEIKHSTTIRIELLEHKLQTVSAELAKLTQQKSSNLLEREQLGRTISQLRQQNHGLTQQLQATRQEYEEILKESVDSGHGSSIRLQSQTSHEVETLRQELSSLIAINLTLSNELSAARDSGNRRSRMHNDNQSSHIYISERGSRVESIRGDSPMNYDRTAHFGYDDMRSSHTRRQRTIDDKFFDRQLKKLKQEMALLKMQNQKVNRRNLELTDMNESLLRGNTSVQQLKKQLNPGLIRVEEDSIEEERRPNKLIRRTTNRNNTRMLLNSSGEDLRSSKMAESKAKWLNIQKKLNDLRAEDEELARLSPSKKQQHQQQQQQP